MGRGAGARNRARGPGPAPTAPAPAPASRRVDRAGDDGVALGVERERTRLPLGRRVDAVRRGAPSRRRRGRRVDARQDVDVAPGALAAELAEPGAVLGDEVEREAVAARRDRRADGDLELGALARARRARSGGAEAVPDDRVAALVEPVVRRGDVARATTAEPAFSISARAPPSAPARGGSSDQESQRATSGPGTGQSRLAVSSPAAPGTVPGTVPGQSQ